MKPRGEPVEPRGRAKNLILRQAQEEGWTGAALLLAGHGSSAIASGGDSVRAQAAALGGRGLFAEVRAGFLREPPLLTDMRAALRAAAVSCVYVVPMFTCRGYICDTLVPRALGLRGGITLQEGGRWLLCEPVGCHPRVVDIIAARIRAMATTFGLEQAAASVLLIAHGTQRAPESFLRTQQIAADLRGRGGLDIQTGFLEQAPQIGAGLSACRRRHVLVIPYMIGAGAHGTIDLPRRLGLDPRDPRLSALSATGQAGPFAVGDRILYLGRAFGSEPELADLVLDQVAGFRR